MNIEDARVIANERFIELFQPVIDAAGEENPIDSERFTEDVEKLKVRIAEETGHEVSMFYVNPLPWGFYDIATVFKVDEVRIKEEDVSEPAYTPG